MKRKDLLGLDGVSREEITSILDTALMMRQVVRSNNKKTPHLQGKSIVTLFYENSTSCLLYTSSMCVIRRRKRRFGNRTMKHTEGKYQSIYLLMIWGWIKLKS